MIAALKPYPAYRESGVEWLGEVPGGWQVLPARRLCRVFAGATPKRDEPSYWEGGTVPWLVSGDVNQRRIRSAGQCITEAGFRASSTRWIEPGSLVIALAGQGKTKGMAALVTMRATCNQSLGVLEPLATACDPEFLLFYFESRYRDIRGLVGDLRDGLTLEHLKRLPVPVPPPPEQDAIARFLRYLDFRVQRLVAARESLIGLLGEQRQAIVHGAITRGLEPDAPLVPSGVDWLGDVPEHWRVRKLSQAFGRIGSGTTPASGDRSYYEDATVPWLVTGDLRDTDVHTTSRKLAARALDDYTALKVYPPGSVVVAMYGATIGRVGLLRVPACVNQACCVLAKPRLLSSEYALLALAGLRPQLVRLGVGGGQPNISQEIIRQFRIPVPPPDQQEAIVGYLRDRLASLDGGIAASSRQIALLREYRTRLISDVVTGKLDVREAAQRLPEDPAADDAAVDEVLEEVAAA